MGWTIAKGLLLGFWLVALGNLLSQMLASGEISDTGAARGLIRASFDLLEI